jgi:drug/metabolite transporter (DMT)-like permease
MPIWGFLLSVLVAFMWAVSPILMKEGLKSCTPNDVPAIRSISFIVTMTFLMVVIQPGKLPFLTAKLAIGLIGSVALSTMLGDLLYVYSVQKIGASLAVSVSAGYPIVTAVVSIILLHEHVRALVWFGTILIIAGLIVIKLDASFQEKAKLGFVLEDFHDKARKKTNLTKGIILALGSALCSGINIPVIKLLMSNGGWTPTENYFLRSVAFFFMAWTLREGEHRFLPNSIKPIEKMPYAAWIALLSSGLIGVALSGVLFAVCIDRFPVSVVTPITASSPFMTVLLSRIILKEKLSKIQNAGIILVIAGSISVSL